MRFKRQKLSPNEKSKEPGSRVGRRLVQGREGGDLGKPKYPCRHAGEMPAALVGDRANHQSPKENTTVIIIPWGLHSHICGWRCCGVAYVLLVRRAACCCCCCCYCCAAVLMAQRSSDCEPIHAGPTSELRSVFLNRNVVATDRSGVSFHHSPRAEPLPPHRLLPISIR